jgi:hypothetical protein
MGKIRTQTSPRQGVNRELTPQQKTLQKDYYDSQRRGLSTEEVVNEQDPCWTGYTQVGMKKKGGRQVPNCVPSKGVPKAKGYTTSSGTAEANIEVLVTEFNILTYPKEKTDTTEQSNGRYKIESGTKAVMPEAEIYDDEIPFS